jgi:4-amino-4-deoxy-L-arabinose transferase-like glycosyltransferase
LGLPEASARELRLGRALALAASTVFFLVALWEIAAPFGAGHFAASSAVTLAGENMRRFGTLLPVTDQPVGIPTTADCYCHHPFGIFWTAAAFVSVLGHHDFVCRLPPLLFSALTPLLLYALGRALWSPISGALAAVAVAPQGTLTSATCGRNAPGATPMNRLNARLNDASDS